MQLDDAESTVARVTEALDDGAMEEDGTADPSNSSANPMSALVESARARAQEYDNEQIYSDQDLDSEDEIDESYPNGVSHPSTTTTSGKNPDNSLRAYAHTFHSILSSASILLYVLDARDPLNTRSRSIERQIAAADAGSKRLILILNKIDLVPPEVLKAWLVYLRRYHPTLPLMVSTPAPNAKTFDHKLLTAKGTLEGLLRALKATAHKLGGKGSTTVGVLGYPNVGKSSVINGLTGLLSSSRGGSNKIACPTGAEAGVTTSVREVKIDNKLKILDSPGIIFPNDDNDDDDDNNHETVAAVATTASSLPKNKYKHNLAHLTLLSALPPKAINDPIPAITLLLSRFQATDPSLSSLLATYNIPAIPTATTTTSTTTTEDLTTPFLVEVARKRGRLGKGGVPNLNAAAMCVLSDWRDGRLSGGWIMPPLSVVAEGLEEEEGANGDDGKEVRMEVGGGERERKRRKGKVADDDYNRAEERKAVREWGEEFRIEGLW